MMPRPPLIAATALLIVLCGCSSTPVTRYYVLSPVAEAPAHTARAPADRAATAVKLVIKDVRLPQYLDRPQIVTRGGDHRLQMSEYEQWAGNLREDMTRVLAENLGRLLESDRVFTAPYNQPMPPDFRVEVEVLRFERDSGGRVTLSARWWLTRGSDAMLVATPGATLYGAPLGENAAYDAVVASMSAVYGELAQAIARSIRSHLAGRSREAGGS